MANCHTLNSLQTTMKPIFYSERQIKYLRSYGPRYPSINTFEAKLKSRGLIESTTTIRFKPSKDSKHYCPSIYAYKVKGVYFIQSFQTIVGAICLNPHVFPTPTGFRFWEGSSRTTTAHVHDVAWRLSALMAMSRRAVRFPDMHGPVADIDVLLDLLEAAEDFDPQKDRWPYSLH